MTAFQWVQLVQFVVMSLASVMLWTLLRAWRGGEMSSRVVNKLQQLDQVATEQSRQIGEIRSHGQTLVDDLRRDHETRFITRVEFAARLEESLRDRARLQVEIDRLWRRRENGDA